MSAKAHAASLTSATVCKWGRDSSTASPTITAIPSLPGVLENSGPQSVTLFGISAGIGDVGETVMLTATSSNPNLIPNPSIRYTNPNTTGTLTFTPVAYGVGTATITVYLMNNGSTANGGVATNSATFNVTVIPVNQPPTFGTITPPQPISTPSEGPTERRFPVAIRREADILERGQCCE